MIPEKHKYEKQIFPIVAVLAITGFSTGGYFYYQIAQEIIQNTATLEGTILELEDKNIALSHNLKKEQSKNQSFENQISEIVQTVGVLDKLSKTDEELLQKYSKVYFLNENYIPSELSGIPKEYLLQKERSQQIHTKALPFLEKIIKAAEKNETPIQIISAYRSFGEQSSLKNTYTVSYGSGANKFSADQGYSEHQLGTTVDFTTKALGANFEKFGDSKAYQWLLENAYKYGFILSYPEGNSYYQFEPWHWRFVGTSLANYLHNENLRFYDVEQKKIDAYLINIFD